MYQLTSHRESTIVTYACSFAFWMMLSCSGMLDWACLVAARALQGVKREQLHSEKKQWSNKKKSVIQKIKWRGGPLIVCTVLDNASYRNASHKCTETIYRSILYLPVCPSHCTLGIFFFLFSSSPIFRPMRVSSIPKISVRLSARYLRWVPICIPSAKTSSCVFFSSTCFFCSSLHRGSRRPERENKIFETKLPSGSSKILCKFRETREYRRIVCYNFW